MLQYLPAFKLPHGNAAFGERRLPEIAPLGRLSSPQQGRNKFPSFGGVRGGLLWLEQSFYVAISSGVQVA
jgi:hypothetical protein